MSTNSKQRFFFYVPVVFVVWSWKLGRDFLLSIFFRMCCLRRGRKGKEIPPHPHPPALVGSKLLFYFVIPSSRCCYGWTWRCVSVCACVVYSVSLKCSCSCGCGSCVNTELEHPPPEMCVLCPVCSPWLGLACPRVAARPAFVCVYVNVCMCVCVFCEFVRVCVCVSVRRFTLPCVYVRMIRACVRVFVCVRVRLYSLLCVFLYVFVFFVSRRICLFCFLCSVCLLCCGRRWWPS